VQFITLSEAQVGFCWWLLWWKGYW